jgi:hypothetical protein
VLNAVPVAAVWGLNGACYCIGSNVCSRNGRKGQFRPYFLPVVGPELAAGDGALGQLLNAHTLLGRHGPASRSFGLEPLADRNRRYTQSPRQDGLIAQIFGGSGDRLDLLVLHGPNNKSSANKKQAIAYLNCYKEN